VRRAAARLLLTAGTRAVQQSIDISGRRAHSNKLAAATCSGRMGQTERQKDGRTDGRPTDA